MQIGQYSKIEKNEIEDLKEEISNYYEIEKSKINILESEK